MLWLGVSTIAQLILGTSAVFDKLLLRRKFFDPWVYTFWAGVLGVIAILLFPIGFVWLPMATILTALSAGALFVAALLFFFLALHKGEASVALPVIGGLAPVFTFLVSSILLHDTLTGGELFGFFILVIGGILFLGAEKKEVRMTIFLLALASAFLFGVSNVLTKLVFDSSPFITGFVWMRVGGALIVLVFLFSSVFRERLHLVSIKSEVSSRLWYVLNRGYAAVGVALVNVAIFLAHPALVDATNSLKYVVIFFAAWFLLHERFRGKILLIKTAAIILIVVGLVWLGLSSYVDSRVPELEPKAFGATFSAFYAERFGLDAKDAYLAVLDDLGVKKMRLPAYWNEIEPEKDVYDFSRLDWQIAEAEKRGVDVVLAVGRKLPRWPECHEPEWARNNELGIRNQELLEYIKETVSRYKTSSAVKIWQVENEPFLSFGECPEFSREFLDEEIALVRSLDPTRPAAGEARPTGRPVMITDSGELSLWVSAARRSDIFGSTLYRTIWNPVVGHFTYPLPPSFFRFKRAMTEAIVGEKPMVIIELQGESWQKKMTYEVSVEEQYLSMNPEAFRGVLDYASRSGFDTFYLWGVEWWYWLKETHGKPEMWQIAKDAVHNTQ